MNPATNPIDCGVGLAHRDGPEQVIADGGQCPPYILPAFDGRIPFYVGGGGQENGEKTHRASSAGVGNAGVVDPAAVRGKTVLFCWELGGGLGHMMQMLPLAEDLAKAGCRVYVALRQLERAAGIFGRAGVSFLQAPLWSGGTARFPRPITYAAMLANVGFGSDGELFARGCAWRNLLRMVRPDLVVFDHSPTALLASRGLPMRRALIGSGFCCPPDSVGSEAWGVLRAGVAEKIGTDRVRGAEEEVLGRVNRILDKWREPGISRLGQLYSEVDENFLATFPELDHFGMREDVGYWGPVLGSGGDVPEWPGEGPYPGPLPQGEGERGLTRSAGRGSRKRVFAYLKRFKGQEELLGHLQKRGYSTIVYLDAADKSLARFECETLRFARRRLDISLVSQSCDLAILNGGHGVTAEMLLAGKPILELPLAFEQRMIADAVVRLGAGESASVREPEKIGLKLDAALDAESCGEAARRFGTRYSAFTAGRQRVAMLNHAIAMMSEAGVMV